MITMATLTVLDQISIGPAHPVFSLFVYGILTIIYMVLCAANRFDFYKRCLDHRPDVQKYRIRIYNCTSRRKPLHFQPHPMTTNNDSSVYRI